MSNKKSLAQAVRFAVARASRLANLHRDERGTISIVTVFSVMLLAMLLGMVMNAGRQADGKIKMQNAADAAAYSGGIALARSLNTLAFTNHLLCDVFSMVAILREGNQKNAQSLTPEILAAWTNIGPILSSAPFTKFAVLGGAVPPQVQREQTMVNAYGAWMKSTSDMILPLWEQILSQELIPQFQRALVAATPQLAQTATAEIARRQGLSSPERGPMGGMLWHATGAAVETPADALPVVDPASNQQAQQTAISQRNTLANNYLNQWNGVMLAGFDNFGRMSQFASLWRCFTCGQLNKLLYQDYPNRNLPFVLAPQPDLSSVASTNGYLDTYFKVVGIVYWPQVRETLPGLFHNANKSDALAFAETMIFVPSPRLGFIPPPGPPSPPSLGGAPGDTIYAPGASGSAPPVNMTPIIGRLPEPTNWDLLNQNWSVKLVPAISAGVLTALQTTPQSVTLIDQGQQRAPHVPSLGNLNAQQLGLINLH